MHSSRRSPATLIQRALILLTLIGVLAGMLAAPVSAVSIRRTWTAPVGSVGANGTVTLKGYMTGPGVIELRLAGLQPSTTYPVMVFRGSCASPIVVTALPSAVTDTFGTIAKNTAIGTIVMNRIWTYGRTGAISIKVGAGDLGRCGPLTYPVATRISIPSLKINLPVVRPPNGYPLCNVAMYYTLLSQPREGGVSFIYAHARVGMFLPLLEKSRINNGSRLLGASILVWTSDNILSTYEIVKVRRHVTTFAGAFSATSEQLWVQTSEGPRGTRGKLIVVAKRISSVQASVAAANPTPRPVVCH